MTRHVTVAPLWPNAVPDPRLNLGKLATLSPSTTERIIGEMKKDQYAYLERLEQTAVPQRRPVTTTVSRQGKMHLSFPVQTTTAAAPAERPERSEPVTAEAVRPSEDVLAGVHPAVAADVLRRAEGDVRRLRVLGPNSVVVLNRPCGE